MASLRPCLIHNDERQATHFDLTDLRLFLHVQEAGTITGGAAASHMTLASASERTRGMEDSLGSPLLSRARRGVQLTPAGRTLARHAQLVRRQIDQLQGELGDYGAGIKGHVRLPCNSSALAAQLPQPLSAFLTAHPGVSVDLEERASDDIVDALRAGLADVGVVSDAADVAGLQAFDFCADPLVLIVPAGHALAEPKSAALIDVVGQPFVGLRDGSAFQAHLDRQARPLGRRLHERVGSFETVCRMVALGVGVGIVPQAVASRDGGKLRRVRLRDAWARRRLLLCVRSLDELPAHARQLLQALLSAAAVKATETTN